MEYMEADAMIHELTEAEKAGISSGQLKYIGRSKNFPMIKSRRRP